MISICTVFHSSCSQMTPLSRSSPAGSAGLRQAKTKSGESGNRFLLRAQAKAYELHQQQQLRQIQRLQLNLQAYDAGLVDLWEVKMFPPSGVHGIPLSVVVPARNSQQAILAAKQRNPKYVAGGARAVPRR